MIAVSDIIWISIASVTGAGVVDSNGQTLYA